MKRIAVLPTMVTLGNGICGFVAITYLLKAYAVRADVNSGLFEHHMELACTLVFAAMVCDALDGSVARLAKVSSEFGAQLDSLADAISFGCVPAMIVWTMASYEGFLQRVAWLTALLFLACAMLRLARYNVESHEHEGPALHFAGLPTPAAAGLVASLALIHFYVGEQDFGAFRERMQSVLQIMVKFMPLVASVAALLMVSRVPYMHLINVMLREQEPFDYVVRIVIVVLFAFFTWPFSLPLAFSLYVAWGLVSWALHGFRPAAMASADEGQE